MKFETLVEQETIGNVTVYGLETVDLSIQTVLDNKLIPIDSLRDQVQRIQKKQDRSFHPNHLCPGIPLELSYRTSSGGTKTVQGLVMGTDRSDLVSFAMDRLESVPNAPALEKLIQTASDEVSLSSSLQPFVTPIEDNPEEISPLLQVPGKTEEIRSVRNPYWNHPRDEHKTMNLTQDGIQNFFNSNILQRGRGTRRSPVRSLQQASHMALLNRSVATQEEQNIMTNDYVIFPAGRSEDRYKWQFRGEQNNTAQVSNLPYELVNQLDQRGSIRLAPEKLWTSTPARFFEPVMLVGGSWEKILATQGREITLDDCLPLMPNRVENQVKRPGMALDSRQIALDRYTAQSTSGPSTPDPRRANNESSSAQLDIPIIEDPELASFVIQRTQQDVYDPDQPAGSLDVIEPCPSTVWIALGSMGFEN